MKKFIKKLVAYAEIGVGLTAMVVLSTGILAGDVWNNIDGFILENFILYSALYTAAAAWIGSSIKDLVKIYKEAQNG